MKIFDFFKRKKKEEEKIELLKKKEEEVKKPSKVTVPKPKPSFAKTTVKEKRTDLGWRILESPHISEKATDLAKKNQYTFRIFPKANKNEVKKAVEGIYGVDVEDVKIIKVPRKRKHRGRVLGWKTGYKKAIVKIREGQKIEVLPR